MWAATCYRFLYERLPNGFNPRGPCGPRRFPELSYTTHYQCFNPRGPCGPRHRAAIDIIERERFQSTRPVWAATTNFPLSIRTTIVSIHAARVGRDVLFCVNTIIRDSFNPRGPCGPRRLHSRAAQPLQGFNPRGPCGPRPGSRRQVARIRRFQSTRPVWAATESHLGAIERIEFQSTRPVWAATIDHG